MTHEKGRRYLTAGALTVHEVRDDLVRASCRGDGDVYDLGWLRDGWWCSCPARTVCSHLLALQLVIDRPSRMAGDERRGDEGPA